MGFAGSRTTKPQVQKASETIPQAAGDGGGGYYEHQAFISTRGLHQAQSYRGRAVHPASGLTSSVQPTKTNVIAYICSVTLFFGDFSAVASCRAIHAPCDLRDLLCARWRIAVLLQCANGMSCAVVGHNLGTNAEQG